MKIKDYTNRAEIIDSVENLEILDIPLELLIGANRELPNLNLPIDYDKLNKAIEFYKNMPWYKIEKYINLKLLKNLIK